jgi:hypothetical protein
VGQQAFGARVRGFDVSNKGFSQVRLQMKKIGWFARLSDQQHSAARTTRIAGGIGVAVLMVTMSIAVAQNPTPAAPLPTPEAKMTTPIGYRIHQSVDLGGRMTNATGSAAMYDTLVNLQSGPRVLGETFEMRALPGQKGTLVDSISAFGSGFGGDPYNLAKVSASKGKVYEFSGLFRRDRQYFDYDLLGNPNIPSGQTIPIGPTATPTGSYAWPQVNQSPFLFNTVRRMTDTNLTIFPLAKVTFRAGYSQNIFQGPSLTPSGYQIGGSDDILLREFQRNSSDDFTGGVDWKPVQGTKLTFEEQIDHYKADSYFTLDPSYLNVQEADGTNVALFANYDALTPYGSSACNPNSLGTAPVLSAPQTAGGLPVINPACAVITSYQRTQPTRILYPTEIFRLQSNTIKSLSMNGDVRYTAANMNLNNYYDSFQGLTKTTRSIVYEGNANAKRQVMAADYGIVWQVVKAFSIDDQINFSSVHQPGTASITSGTTLATPATPGNETINYAGALITTNAATGTSSFEGSAPVGTSLPAYFGQRFLTNNLTGSWDASSRITLSLTYRYQTHMIAENAFVAATATVPVDPGGNPGNNPLAVNATNNGTVTIDENGGILTAAFRPTANWNINGSVEMLYADNAFTPMTPRQTRQYRVHTMYKPKPWAVVSGSFNDVEHHNNTNNDQAAVTAKDVAYAGPLDHVDYSRVVGLGAQLFPNDHYGIDFDYAYSDVYMADNICYLGGAATGLPAASTPSGTTCPATAAGRSGYDFGPALDFEHAPTQFGSVAFTVSPAKTIKSNIGYRISSVNGTRFYNDPRDVAGSLVSTYQTPFVNVAWKFRPGLTWKAEYNFSGYGEGGPSGAALCSAANPTPTAPAAPVACSSLPYQTGMNISPAGETAPRNFHANNVTLGLHYEF